MTEPTEHTKELARAYAEATVPAMKQAMALKGDAALLLMDMSLLTEPIAEIAAANLTDEELQQAIAWTESALCAKLIAIQPKVAAAVQKRVFLALAMGSLSKAEEDA